MFLKLGLFPLLPGTPALCYLVKEHYEVHAFRGKFQEEIFPPLLRKGPVGWFSLHRRIFCCTCRCTAAWKDFPSTRRGRLPHQPSGAWVRRRTIGSTAWGAWRAATAAGSLGLLKCESCATEPYVFPQQLRWTSPNFLWPVLGGESFVCAISTGEALIE